jgi:VanZ family protein
MTNGGSSLGRGDGASRAGDPPSRGEGPARGLRSRWPVRALVAYCALLAGGALAPFEFTLDRSEVSAPVEWVPLTYRCPTHGVLCPYDKLLNFVIFVPLGALVAKCLVGRSARRASVAAVASGLGFSLALEAAQLLLPTRFPSASDILMNAVGALAGAVGVAWFDGACTSRRRQSRT